MTIQLTSGQQKALDMIVEFCLDDRPDAENRLVIAGYAGTGKTELLSIAMRATNEASELKNTILKAAGKRTRDLPQFLLTATTNKAAEALQEATDARINLKKTFFGDDNFMVSEEVYTVKTIHSLLGIRPIRDKVKKITKVTNTNFAPRPAILIIDEASFIDNTLLKTIDEGVSGKHKIIYVGDPAQLSPVKSKSTPVFDQNYKTTYLTEVVRQQADNQIINVSTSFRNTVNGEQFAPFKPDQNKVIYLDAEKFKKNILEEFSRPDYSEKDAKVLAWTNKTVKKYNALVKEHLTGDQELKAGDYAVNNSYFEAGKKSVKTDAVVRIREITNDYQQQILPPSFYHIDTLNLLPSNEKGERSSLIECRKIEFTYKNTAYSGLMPIDPIDFKRALKKLNDLNDGGYKRYFNKIRNLDDWIDTFKNLFVDLRPMYACTVNKSQGSTYKKVFIDLDDIGKCNQVDQVHRMLYVSFSRASDQVVLTGDIV